MNAMTSQNVRRWRGLGRLARVVGAGFAAAAILPATASAACTNRVVNPGFETGTAPWVQTGTVIKPDTAGIAAPGSYYAGFRNNGDALTQTGVTLDPACPNYRLRYSLKVYFGLVTSVVYDRFYVTVSTPYSTYTSNAANNLTETGLYFTYKSIYFPNMQGPVTLRFFTTQNATYPTHFVIDDVLLIPY
jgi:aminopeptidase S